MNRQPFAGGSAIAALTPAERAANYEATRLACRSAVADDATAADTRNAILHAMGAWAEDIVAPAELLQLLERHEANLRQAWEHIELGRARQRAEEAMRGAVRAMMDGQLL
jgi:hypothetical protein